MHVPSRLILGLVGCLLPVWVWSQSPTPPASAQRWQTVFQTVMKENQDRLMVGDLDGYVNAVTKASNSDDWTSLNVAGDVLYRVSSAAALTQHEAAAKLAPGEPAPQLELAFDYQNSGQCERAVPAWQAADKLGALRSPETAVAAYCFFRTGRIDEALALWARVQWPKHRVALDFALSDMAIGKQAMHVHIQNYAKARTGDRQALELLISNAVDWRKDWWNSSLNRQAFDAARSMASKVWPKDSQLQRELDCANDASLAKDADGLMAVMRRCNFWAEGGELPASSAIAKYLLARLDAMKLAAPSELLARWGTKLEQRTQSKEGDIAALEALAYLQVYAKDYAGLKATDDLGWHRYRLATFAVSRIAGATTRKEEWASQGEALLKEALIDFPDQALLHKFRYELFPPAPEQRERQLLEWIFAEYAGPTANMPGVGLPSSSTLASLVYTLRKRREERAAAPKI